MSDLKVATTYEEESGAIYQHFGHCKSFKIFHVSGKEITSAAVVSSPLLHEDQYERLYIKSLKLE